MHPLIRYNSLHHPYPSVLPPGWRMLWSEFSQEGQQWPFVPYTLYQLGTCDDNKNGGTVEVKVVHHGGYRIKSTFWVPPNSYTVETSTSGRQDTSSPVPDACESLIAHLCALPGRWGEEWRLLLDGEVSRTAIERSLAEARALLEWPERDTPPTLAEVEAGHPWWMARDVREQRWHMIYCVKRAIGNPPLARVMAVGSGWSLSCYDRFRRCTPDGKPALLPEVKG